MGKTITGWESEHLRREPVLRKTKHITEAVKKLKLPEDKVVVVGGAALQVFGIKLTRDIDLVTEPSLYEEILSEFSEQYPWQRQRLGERPSRRRVGAMTVALSEDKGQIMRNDRYGITKGDVTFMQAPDDELYQASFEELQAEAIEVYGVLVSPPQRILEWKLAVGRRKDIADVPLIESYLAELSAISSI